MSFIISRNLGPITWQPCRPEHVSPMLGNNAPSCSYRSCWNIEHCTA